MKTNKFLLSFLFAYLAVLIIAYILLPVSDSEFIFEGLFLISITLSVIITYISNKGASLVVLFLLFVLFFNGTRPIVDFIGLNDINTLDFFYEGHISAKDNCRALLNLSIATVSIVIGHLLFICKYTKSTNKSSSNIIIPSFILYLLFIIGFAAKIYESYKSFSFLSAFSYHEMFISGESIPIYVRVLELLPLFVCLYKLSLGHKIWMIWFFIYIVLGVATGQRGPAMMSLVIMIYFLAKKNVIKLNLKRATFFVVTIFVFSTAVSNLRNNKDFFTEDDTFTTFLWDQGVTYSQLQIVIKERDKLKYSLADMFGNVYSTFKLNIRPNIYCPDDHLSTTAKKYRMWSKYISYETNPKLYYLGMGLGGNYIAQVFCVGGEMAVFIFSMLVGFFLNFIDKRLIYGNILLTFICFNLLISVLYIPRDNYFQFLTAMIEPLLASFLLYFIYIGVKLLKS